MVEIDVILPDGTAIPGDSPIIVVGPNGSGKTRKTRELQAAVPEIGFVNALRNTRVAAELPAVGADTARNNYAAQRAQARSMHWELSSEFDYMLSNLLAQDAMVSKHYADEARKNGPPSGPPPDTPMSNVQKLWGEVFPGRVLTWRDWKPFVTSTVSNPAPAEEYSGSQMSDGEKSALYLLGRVMSADPGVLVVDEPETHFHSLLAVRLWDALEQARQDIRFVYVTHDLTFALSRRDGRFVLASPLAGLRVIEVDSTLPSDVAAALLGSASLSFYASRVVFCEGIEGSFDGDLFRAWFDGQDTVVRPVEDCQTVLRCVSALTQSNITQSLEVLGLTDSDYHPPEFLAHLPAGAVALPVHEIESLYALPGVVEAVAQHNSAQLDRAAYVAAIKASVNEDQRRAIVMQRWRERVEKLLVGVASQAGRAGGSLDDVTSQMSTIFDPANWSFSPVDKLESERRRLDAALAADDVDELLLLIPGKQLVPLAARAVGMTTYAYRKLVVGALRSKDGSGQQTLRDSLITVLEPKLPPRRVAPAQPLSSDEQSRLSAGSVPMS